MARSRLELQLILEAIPGVQMVKFQPSDSTRLTYPCIIYSRDSQDVTYADNHPFRTDTRYMVTVIDRNPDSLIPSLVAKLPYCSFSRFYVADDLNHDVYALYF
jgi:hypothetical protein